MAESLPVESIFKDYLNKPDINSRVLAVYSLGAIDDSSALLEVLGNERQFAPVRIASINALRNWISRDAKNDGRLFEAIERRYSSITAEVVLHLLHGFSPIQLEQPAAYANLIGYLNHSALPVRELAYRQLLLLVPEGRAIPYDPAGGRILRDRAVEEWKKLIPEGTVPRKN
jgi:HEAT repeat protein